MFRQSILASALLLTITLAGTALGQVGVLDQLSPYAPSAGNASFNEDATFLVWQQQIRVGLSGQLEGIRVAFANGSPVGSKFNMTIRLGPAWSGGAVIFAGSLTSTIGAYEEQFVDMTASNIQLTAGDVFVMETVGTGTGAWMMGSYVDPALGPPLYPEPLFLTSTLFSNDGWRHGFGTYMLVGSACSPCDTNCDGSTNQFDIQPFIVALIGGSGCSPCAADTNEDGSINQFDIQGFINCLTAP